MDVSTYSQTGYPDPELTVNCDEDYVVVQSNGIPNFEFTQITPNALQAQTVEWRIPRYPTEASSLETIEYSLGAVGVAVNGLPLFGPNEAPTHGWGDPYLDGILDYCNGHTGPGGDYHFHARPDCLWEDLDGQTHLVVGYAFDGYPILAPWACDDVDCTSVTKMESSWKRTTDVTDAWQAHDYVEGSGTLDECNGTVGSDGTYRYYATDTFPYLFACYRGLAERPNPGGGGG